MVKSNNKNVTFSVSKIINYIEYYDRFNWDLIDTWRRRDIILNKWNFIINKLVYKN